MKMKLFVVAFLISIAVMAQDGYNQPREHYEQIKIWTDNISAQETRDFSDFLIGQTPYNFSFWRSIETSNSLTYVYTFDEETMLRGGADVATVEFIKINERYNFRAFKIHNEGSDAIYVWVRVFLHTATFDLVRQNYKYRDLISVDQNVRIRLLNGDEIKSFKKDKRTKH